MTVYRDKATGRVMTAEEARKAKVRTLEDTRKVETVSAPVALERRAHQRPEGKGGVVAIREVEIREPAD